MDNIYGTKPAFLLLFGLSYQSQGYFISLDSANPNLVIATVWQDLMSHYYFFHRRTLQLDGSIIAADTLVSPHIHQKKIHHTSDYFLLSKKMIFERMTSNIDFAVLKAWEKLHLK